jgi:hypothetical protein
MFPVLAVAAAGAAGYAMVKAGVMAIIAIKLLAAKQRSDHAHAREVVDVNPVFEKGLSKRLREPFNEPEPVTENKALEMGVGNLSEVPVPKDLLPAKYQNLDEFWYVSRKDDIVLWYFLLRMQARHEHGQVGALLRTLSERSGIPYEKIERRLFCVDDIDQCLEAVVLTIQDTSRSRYASPILSDALRQAKAA